MWNKWEMDDNQKPDPIVDIPVRVSDFWEPRGTPPDNNIFTSFTSTNWYLWPQNQVPDTVARLLEKIPDYTSMAPYSIPQSFTGEWLDAGFLATEIPPRIYSHPEVPQVIFYNWSWRDRAIQHYLSLTGRTQDAQVEVYLSTTEWMNIYQGLPWTPQEKVQTYQEIFNLWFYGVIDWDAQQLREFEEATYFWARTTDKHLDCNAMRLSKYGIQPVFVRNAHGLLLLLPILES